MHSDESINKLNRDCYNARADYWDRLPFCDVLPNQIKLLHNSDFKALDIGSGTGLFAQWLQQNNFDVLCIDPSEEMIKRCRAKDLTTKQTTIQDFECSDKFGLIAAILSLIHVPKKDIAAQINRIANWLNPGGTFVLALIEGSGEGVGEQHSEYPRYFSYYTRQEVLDLTNEHFTCLFEKNINGYFLFIFQTSLFKLPSPYLPK